MISTYPPTQCGLASFASSLRDSLRARRLGTVVGVVRMVDGPASMPTAPVVHELVSESVGDAAAAAAELNRFDVAVVQHEYGIFGGDDGEQILAVLAQVHVPVIVVLHTVLSNPTPHQRYVLEQLVAASDTVVTLSRTGHLRLRAGYDIDHRKAVMIPHGAWAGGRPESAGASEHVGDDPRPTVLTWGLLGPGKGLEWGVDAMAALRDLDPRPVYVVAGQTHPRVLARDGERYRESLRAKAIALGITDMLRFEPGYLSAPTLRGLVARADVILLPYDSHEQVTSGVLIEAVSSLTPVVSTAFPHARELLANGVGMLVPHADPAAISVALRRVLTEPGRAPAMIAGAARVAPTLDWSAVADQYLQLGDELSRRATVAA